VTTSVITTVFVRIVMESRCIKSFRHSVEVHAVVVCLGATISKVTLTLLDHAEFVTLSITDFRLLASRSALSYAVLSIKVAVRCETLKITVAIVDLLVQTFLVAVQTFATVTAIPQSFRCITLELTLPIPNHRDIAVIANFTHLFRNAICSRLKSVSGFCRQEASLISVLTVL
jgi:hypothetical protein